MQDQPDETGVEASGAASTSSEAAVQPKHDIPAKGSKPAQKSTAKAPIRKEPAKPKNAAPLPWTFPKNTLEDAIKIARAIEEQNAGNPMRPELLMRAVGYNSLADWRFLDLLRSANQYGLVTGTGKKTPVALTDIGRDIVAPSSPSARPKALREAFRTVEDFRKVEDYYQGKRLPEDEFFENTLNREFSIPRERVKAFIETFTSNLNYLHAFRPDRTALGPSLEQDFRPTEPDLPADQDGNFSTPAS